MSFSLDRLFKWQKHHSFLKLASGKHNPRRGLAPSFKLMKTHLWQSQPGRWQERPADQRKDCPYVCLWDVVCGLKGMSGCPIWCNRAFALPHLFSSCEAGAFGREGSSSWRGIGSWGRGSSFPISPKWTDQMPLGQWIEVGFMIPPSQHDVWRSELKKNTSLQRILGTLVYEGCWGF